MEKLIAAINYITRSLFGHTHRSHDRREAAPSAPVTHARGHRRRGREDDAENLRLFQAGVERSCCAPARLIRRFLRPADRRAGIALTRAQPCSQLLSPDQLGVGTRTRYEYRLPSPLVGRCSLSSAGVDRRPDLKRDGQIVPNSDTNRRMPSQGLSLRGMTRCHHSSVKSCHHLTLSPQQSAVQTAFNRMNCRGRLKKNRWPSNDPVPHQLQHRR